MCNCGGKSSPTWTVTYPPETGRAPEVKKSETAARIAAQRVEGATYAQNAK